MTLPGFLWPSTFHILYALGLEHSDLVGKMFIEFSSFLCLGKFELQSFDVGVVRIFNVREKLFIAVDKKGRAYVTVSANTNYKLKSFYPAERCQ